VHVLVSNAAQDAGGRPFSFFEFALLGVPLLVGTIAIVVLIGSKVLPHRDATTMPPDLSALAATLARDCDLDVDNPDTLYSRKQGVAELVIPPRSGLIGKKAFPGMVTESGNLTRCEYDPYVCADRETVATVTCHKAAGPPDALRRPGVVSCDIAPRSKS